MKQFMVGLVLMLAGVLIVMAVRGGKPQEKRVAANPSPARTSVPGPVTPPPIPLSPAPVPPKNPLQDLFGDSSKRMGNPPDPGTTPGATPSPSFPLGAQLVKNLSVEELAEKLELDATMVAVLAQAIEEGKQRVFELLSSKRADGASFLDDLAGAATGGNPDESRGKAWLKLFTEKVPGTEDPYIKRYVLIQQDVNKSLEQSLGPSGKFDTYKKMMVDPLNVKTAKDPVGCWLKDRGLPPLWQ